MAWWLLCTIFTHCPIPSSPFSICYLVFFLLRSSCVLVVSIRIAVIVVPELEFTFAVCCSLVCFSVWPCLDQPMGTNQGPGSQGDVILQGERFQKAGFGILAHAQSGIKKLALARPNFCFKSVHVVGGWLSNRGFA